MPPLTDTLTSSAAAAAAQRQEFVQDVEKQLRYVTATWSLTAGLASSPAPPRAAIACPLYVCLLVAPSSCLVVGAAAHCRVVLASPDEDETATFPYMEKRWRDLMCDNSLSPAAVAAAAATHTWPPFRASPVASAVLYRWHSAPLACSTAPQQSQPPPCPPEERAQTSARFCLGRAVTRWLRT
jgi:hypothetical protein